MINPYQKLYQVRTAYTELEGVVPALTVKDGERKLFLGGGSESYRISPEAVFSYEDNYVNIEAMDSAFRNRGTGRAGRSSAGDAGAAAPAPSTGEVQYLAVKRQVALGTVSETSVADGKIRLESGVSYRLLREPR